MQWPQRQLVRFQRAGRMMPLQSGGGGGKEGQGAGGAAVLQTQECTHVSEQLFAEHSSGSAGESHGVDPYLDCGSAAPLPTDMLNPTLGARLPAIDMHPPKAAQRLAPTHKYRVSRLPPLLLLLALQSYRGSSCVLTFDPVGF